MVRQKEGREQARWGRLGGNKGGKTRERERELKRGSERERKKRKPLPTLLSDQAL